MNETCFVIMPTVTQKHDGKEYKLEELKQRYDTIIKHALLKAKKTLQIARADEVSMPGSITNDILIMYSNYVVVDISLPNANVFYALGLRHAIKTKTILIKDRQIRNTGFDISHLRYIEYDYTPAGLEELTEKLEKRFLKFDQHPMKPDNQFYQYAEAMNYQYPRFIENEHHEDKSAAIATYSSSP